MLPPTVPTVELRTCPRCQRQKPLEGYAASQWQRRGPCRSCQTPSGAAATHRYVTYGLSTSDYDRLLAECEGRCGICRKATKLVVDHDHATGRVRGLLCGGCNKGLGLFRDDPEALVAAAGYLRR